MLLHVIDINRDDFTSDENVELASVKEAQPVERDNFPKADHKCRALFGKLFVQLEIRNVVNILSHVGVGDGNSVSICSMNQL